MEGYENKEVCVNIELFLLVFVHEKSPRRAFAAREQICSRINVLWFLMDFCQVSYRYGLLKVGKYGMPLQYKEFCSSHFPGHGNRSLMDHLMFAQRDYVTICHADSKLTIHWTLLQLYNPA